MTWKTEFEKTTKEEETVFRSMHLFVLFILHTALVVTSSARSKEPNQILAGAGNFEEGVTPDVVFINFLTTLPTYHHPTRQGGPRKETPPNQRFMLSPYMLYSVNVFYGLLTIFLLLHIYRRRPIDNTEVDETSVVSKAEEQKLEEMRSIRRSERSRLFFYKRWTSHVATSHKLISSFERDFDVLSYGLDDEEYIRRNRLTVERMIFDNPIYEDEDF